MEIASLTIVGGLTFGNFMIGALAVVGLLAIGTFLAMKLINYARNTIITGDTKKLNDKELRRIAREEMKSTFATKEKALQEKQSKIQNAAKAIVEATNEAPETEEATEVFGI